MIKILKVSGLSSAAWYDKRLRKAYRASPGPKPAHAEAEILYRVKELLLEPEFYGEGYKKLKKRLADLGIRVGKERLRRILSENNLLAPQRAEPNGSGRLHDGSITTLVPNKMWGTDIKEFYIKGQKHYIISVIDHFNGEIHGYNVTAQANRFTVLQALHNAVMKCFLNLENDVCKESGLQLRADHGSQFDSKTYAAELAFLGITPSPAFVRSPQCNGIIERYHRTLNEQVFYLMSFEDIEHARYEIDRFVEKYNQRWLYHRLGLRSPQQYRLEYEENGLVR
jgi:putative transposase